MEYLKGLTQDFLCRIRFAMSTINIIQIIYKLNPTPLALQDLWWGFYCESRGEESGI